MQDKETLKAQIEKIPIFEMRTIGTQKTINDELTIKVLFEDIYHKGITEENGTKILAMVSNGYKVVQFKEVYNPVLEEFQDLHGYIKYHQGMGFLVVFPDLEEFNTGEHKIGLLLKNSVDKSSAVKIELCVKVGEYTILLPDRNSLRAIHLGKIKELLKNYQSFILDVKKEWELILTKLQNKELDESQVDSLLSELRFTKKTKESMKEKLSSFNLWNVFISMIETITDKEYKNEINQMRKIKQVTTICLEYATIEKI